MKCVEVDQFGAVVADNLSTAPNCAGYLLLSPTEFQTMTYWAQLAQALDPSQPALWELMTATLLCFIAAFGVKQLARLIVNR